MLQLPDAVLWDMDGTLIDSEPYWMVAETELVERFGGTWSTQQGLDMVGNSLPKSAEILQRAGVDLPVAEIIAALLQQVEAKTRERTPWMPGARELLVALAAAGVPCALVTASYRSFADIVVAQSDGALTAVVTGDEVTNGKPHPEPYLRAARLLDVPIERCIAIEDSPPGITSALTAGARVLGVQSHVPLPEHSELSRARTLELVGLTTLARIAAGEVLTLGIRPGD